MTTEPLTCEKLRDYDDEDLTFCVHTYHDFHLLSWSLPHLRRFYPRSRVVVISDGDSDLRIGALAADFGAECVYGERLFPLSNGGKLLQRMLQIHSEKPTPYLVKIDPDTGFHRRFSGLPRGDGIFGTLCTNVELSFVQGGFVGLTGPVCAKLYKSNVLLSPDLVDYRRTWLRKNPQHWARVEQVGTILDEKLLGYCAMGLRIKQMPFEEVNCQWRVFIDNSNLRWAVTHPRKDCCAWYDFTYGLRTDFKDEDLTFALDTGDSESELQHRLASLRTLYPTSPLLLLEKQGGGLELADFALHFGAKIVAQEQGPSAYAVQHLLRTYLERNTPYLFFLSADTILQKRFSSLPVQDCLFGELRYQRGDFFPADGIFGLAEAAARRFFVSQALLVAELSDFRSTWAARTPEIWDQLELRPFAAIGRILGYTAMRLHIRQCQHDLSASKL